MLTQILSECLKGRKKDETDLNVKKNLLELIKHTNGKVIRK